MKEKKILDKEQIQEKIKRISYEIYEESFDDKSILICGIEENGSIIAKKIIKELQSICDIKIEFMSIDLNKRRVDLLISKIEFKKRRKKIKVIKFDNQTPWQEISRSNVGQLEDGACIRSRGLYIDIAEKKGIPRNNH